MMMDGENHAQLYVNQDFHRFHSILREKTTSQKKRIGLHIGDQYFIGILVGELHLFKNLIINYIKIFSKNEEKKSIEFNKDFLQYTK